LLVGEKNVQEQKYSLSPADSRKTDEGREQSTPHKNIMRNKKESVQITLATELARRVQKLFF
jgi:hypothetical protein